MGVTWTRQLKCFDTVPKVVSPLKVVPKKGNKYRLILDLSKLNKCLVFPRFKYDSIAMVAEVFDLDDWLFAFDMKDGYWHCAFHSDMWEYIYFCAVGDFFLP